MTYFVACDDKSQIAIVTAPDIERAKEKIFLKYPNFIVKSIQEHEKTPIIYKGCNIQD